MQKPVDVGLPFRWDLVAPDQLGSLLSGTAAPDLWFLDDLAKCASKVVARSGDSDLFFVGRSLDSMYDLLSGALAGSDPVLCRLPFSFARPASRTGRWWRARPLSAAERAQARRLMSGQTEIDQAFQSLSARGLPALRGGGSASTPIRTGQAG